jgi:hypothetical protein
MIYKLKTLFIFIRLTRLKKYFGWVHFGACWHKKAKKPFPNVLAQIAQKLASYKNSNTNLNQNKSAKYVC